MSAAGTTRYAAFLRGVSPSNARMPAVAAALAAAGFEDVRTVLSSGNVLFGARRAATARLERAVEAALATLPTAFPAIVREVDALRSLVEREPFARFRLAPGAKRVVTFLRDVPPSPPRLPVERDGARILRLEGREVFTAYVPGPRGGAFMAVIEKTFGKDVTTRTWETVRKVASVG